MPGEQVPFDLEERAYLFAKRVRSLVKRLPRTMSNIEDVRQLVRASGSVGANYIEANEALSQRDMIHRLRISRKEAKESRLFLRLVDTGDDADVESERMLLIAEATDLLRILSAMINKCA